MKRQNTGRHRSVQSRRHAHIPLKQHRVEALSSSSSLRFLHRRLPHRCSSSLLLQCGQTIPPFAQPGSPPACLNLSSTSESASLSLLISDFFSSIFCLCALISRREYCSRRALLGSA